MATAKRSTVAPSLNCGDYCGIHSPEIREWIVSQQVTASAFYSVFPEASLRSVWKALKAKAALDIVLDPASSHASIGAAIS